MNSREKSEEEKRKKTIYVQINVFTEIQIRQYTITRAVRALNRTLELCVFPQGKEVADSRLTVGLERRERGSREPVSIRWRLMKLTVG